MQVHAFACSYRARPIWPPIAPSDEVPWASPYRAPSCPADDLEFMDSGCHLLLDPAARRCAEIPLLPVLAQEKCWLVRGSCCGAFDGLIGSSGACVGPSLRAVWRGIVRRAVQTTRPSNVRFCDNRPPTPTQFIFPLLLPGHILPAPLPPPEPYTPINPRTRVRLQEPHTWTPVMLRSRQLHVWLSVPRVLPCPTDRGQSSRMRVSVDRCRCLLCHFGLVGCVELRGGAGGLLHDDGLLRHPVHAGCTIKPRDNTSHTSPTRHRRLNCALGDGASADTTPLQAISCIHPLWGAPTC